MPVVKQRYVTRELLRLVELPYLAARDPMRVAESIKFIAEPNRHSVLAACRQLAKYQPGLFFPDSEALR